MVILIAILVLGFLIFVHELGHFMVAKIVGIQVDEFSIGFGPKLLGYQKKGRYYSIFSEASTFRRLCKNGRRKS